jgi:hypothetical protein
MMIGMIGLFCCEWFTAPGMNLTSVQILHGYEQEFFNGVIDIGESMLRRSLYVQTPNGYVIHVKLNLTAIVFSYVLILPVGIAMYLHVADTLVALHEFSGIIDVTKFNQVQGFTKQIMVCGVTGLLLGHK